MLKKRLIPKLLLEFKKNHNTYTPILVSSKNFKSFTNIGDPISQAKIYESQLADEIALFNMRSLNISENIFILDFIKKFSTEIFMPLTVGGGVKSIDCIRKLLQSGADKISINSAAVLNPSFIKEAAETFGSQSIVVSIDFKVNEAGQEMVFYNGGNTASNLKVLDWAKKVQDLGAGEIILTDIYQDGSNEGLNLKVGELVAKNLDIPIILSGGCGLAYHFIEAFKKTKIQGVAAGNFFCHKDQNIFQTRAQILNNGIALRKA